MKKYIRFLFFIILFCFSFSVIFAYEPTVTIEPYTQDNIPTWVEDIHRTEIITFGSLPFVTLSVSLGYSFYRFFSNDMDSSYLMNPLSSSSASLSTDEQIGIITSSLIISTLLGLTDLTINLIKRNSAKKTAAKLEKGSVVIQPIPLQENIEENFDVGE